MARMLETLSHSPADYFNKAAYAFQTTLYVSIDIVNLVSESSGGKTQHNSAVNAPYKASSKLLRFDAIIGILS